MAKEFRSREPFEKLDKDPSITMVLLVSSLPEQKRIVLRDAVLSANPNL
jgi:hypothetical protein